MKNDIKRKPRHVSNRRFNPRKQTKQTREVVEWSPDDKKHDESFTDLFQTVADDFAKCEKFIWDAQDKVGFSSTLKQAVKTKLLKKFHNIFREANDIVDYLGRIGRVK